MNSLEKTLLDATKRAWEKYEQMTDGWWLSHAPESFLQNFVALHLARTHDHSVYPECSPKKIREDLWGPIKGRKPNNQQQRFDVVVWWKTKAFVRAVIEIKRAYTTAPIQKDRQKISDYLKQAQAKDVRCGYLLVYSEAAQNLAQRKKSNGRSTLVARFKKWGPEIGAELVGYDVRTPRMTEDGKQWSWGVALYRVRVDGAK